MICLMEKFLFFLMHSSTRMWGMISRPEFFWSGKNSKESNKRANMRWIMGGFIVYNSYQNINMICSLELIRRKDGFLCRKYSIFKDHFFSFYSYSFYVFLPLSYSPNLDGGSGSYLMISVLEIQYCGIPDKGLGESGLGGGWALLSITTIVRKGREGTLPQTLL